jgi:anti-sigma factor RsiW
MSGSTHDSIPCDMVRDELSELALGVLSGRRRSEVLDHVSDCPRCSSELQQLSMVTDALLQLTPQADPPVGFELRVAQRIQAADVVRPKRRWRVAVLGAAAVVLVALGVGVGALATSRGSGHQPRAGATTLSNADLTSRGRVVGEVVLSSGPPGWMFVALNGTATSGPVRCDVTLSGGKVESVGVFQVSGEYGAWGAPLTAPANDVRSVQLVDSTGSVVAGAQFGT